MKNSYDGAFDNIMEKVGYYGTFQKIYYLIYVVVLTFSGSMIYMNLILALNVPDHWCHVPGIERTNFTKNEWRLITLPKGTDNRGEDKFDTCKMYNKNFTSVEHWDYEKWNYSNIEITDCTHGFEYDKEWYKRTIATQENWVCGKDLYVTNTFVVSRIAEVIGAFCFGQLGDTIGRKIVYYIGVTSVLIGRVASILTTHSFTWFMVSIIVFSIATSGFFNSPLIIAMEISQDEQRSNIAMIQSIGWSFGTCLMPLIYWWWKDWVPFMWFTSLLPLVVVVFDKFMIESPRWLISKRKFKRALKQFKIIAKINRRNFTLTEKEITDIYSEMEEEKVYGIMSLFSGWRIARNTLIMAFSWCVVAVSYFTLVLNSSRMGGNPFLNFFLQSIVEVPAYVVGKYLADKIGRRLTNSLSYFCAASILIPIILIAKNPKYEMAVIVLSIFVKFINGIVFFAVFLQAMEVYPTCLRQTGNALGVICSNGVGSLAPYMVYLGVTYDIRYPYLAMAILFTLGGLSTIFLPETLHQRLPDSLEEAKRFGEDQKFFSLPKAKKNKDEDDMEKVKMNQKKFEP